MEQCVQAAIQDLLERKHLFQSVTVDLSKVRTALLSLESEERELAMMLGPTESYEATRESITQLNKKRLAKWEYGEWVLRTTAGQRRLNNPRTNPDGTLTEFPLPVGVQIACSFCKGTWPHNPPDAFPGKECSVENVSSAATGVQAFLISYLCQKCRSESVCFLIHRDRLKLTLTGRSQFEHIPVPAYIPEPISKHYRNSIIAFRTGFTLAACCYLRVALEQFMRQETNTSGKIDLSDLAGLYGKTLPDDFKSRFPSLRDVSEKLSVALHSATENAEAFKQCLADVDRHFDARRLFHS